jgi:hypothetical protein
MSDGLATIIHITGAQRSGHSFVGRLLTNNLGAAWWKQHDDEPWIVKLTMVSQLMCITPWLRHLTAPEENGGCQVYPVVATEFLEARPPSSCELAEGVVVDDLHAIRVTEYASPKWFHTHIPKVSKTAVLNINVIRDPRNLLASAVGKGWDEQHCRDLMETCEFQYTNPTIQSYVNVSYEKLLAHVTGPGDEKVVGGVKINDWALPVILALQGEENNSSFDPVNDNQEYTERYKRPDIVSNPIFKSLISKAEEIYKVHHTKFLEGTDETGSIYPRA